MKNALDLVIKGVSRSTEGDIQYIDLTDHHCHALRKPLPPAPHRIIGKLPAQPFLGVLFIKFIIGKREAIAIEIFQQNPVGGIHPANDFGIPDGPESG